jgi:hypothetical protein
MATLVQTRKPTWPDRELDYTELEKFLPQDYRALLTPRETQQAIVHVKRYGGLSAIEEHFD